MLSLGGTEMLRAAISACDEAIALRQDLDLAVPDYRDGLANTLSNKGAALRSLGGADGLRAAIYAFDQAVALRKELDLAVPEHRDRLASTLTAKGAALQSLGCTEGLQAAIAVYDEAIALCRGLDLAVPDYRDNLADALTAKGAALQSLGGTEGLQAAIAAYDEAIALRQGLDLDVPRYRDSLATALTTRGDALQSLGGTEGLQAAVVAFDEAIALRRNLDLAFSGYRLRLATTWIERGRAASHLNPADSNGEARSSFEAGWTLLATVVEQRRSPDPDFVRGMLHSAFYYLVFLVDREDCEMATDVGDTALAGVRALEAAGSAAGHANRELVFERTLTAYSRLHSYSAMVEVIFENLDPVAPGSACDSANMQSAAADALRDALANMIARGVSGPILGQMLSAQRRLAGLHTLAFGGTAISVRLRAMTATARGESGGAEAILISYRTRCPDDPDGAIVWAERQLQRGSVALAVAALDEAVRLMLARNPEAPEAGIERMAVITQRRIHLRLLEVAEQSVGRRPAEALERNFASVRQWALEVLGAELLYGASENAREAWQPVLGSVLSAAWRACERERAHLLSQVNDLTDPVRRAAVRRETIAEVSAELGRLLEQAAPLPARWEDFLREAQAAELEAREAFAHLPPEQRQAATDTTIVNMMERITSNLKSAELDQEQTRLAKLPGSRWWVGLDERERKYLVTALRLRDEPANMKYMLVELGCAVEYSLDRLLLQPLRNAILSEGLVLPQQEERFHRGVAADSGHSDQPIRLIVITDSGDLDHAARLG